MSKGSRQRVAQVSRDELAERWSATFGACAVSDQCVDRMAEIIANLGVAEAMRDPEFRLLSLRRGLR